MREYRTVDGQTVVVERRRGGGFFLALLVIAALVVALLFATGFFKATVAQPGALPSVNVNAGALPKVDFQSKKIVVGTEKKVVEVPKIGVTDGDQKGN